MNEAIKIVVKMMLLCYQVRDNRIYQKVAYLTATVY